MNLKLWMKDKKLGPFVPHAWYNADGNQLEVFWYDDPSYGEQVGSSDVTLHFSQETGEVVGVTVGGIRQVMGMKKTNEWKPFFGDWFKKYRGSFPDVPVVVRVRTSPGNELTLHLFNGEKGWSLLKSAFFPKEGEEKARLELMDYADFLFGEPQ